MTPGAVVTPGALAVEGAGVAPGAGVGVGGGVGVAGSGTITRTVRGSESLDVTGSRDVMLKSFTPMLTARATSQRPSSPEVTDLTMAPAPSATLMTECGALVPRNVVDVWDGPSCTMTGPSTVSRAACEKRSSCTPT